MEQVSGSNLIVRPMSFGEVIDAGISLARQNFGLLVQVAAVGYIPGVVFGLITAAVMAAVASTGSLAALGAMGVVLAVLGIIVLIVALLSNIALPLACARLIEGPVSPQDLTIGGLYRSAWSVLGRYILFAIVIAIIAIPLVILFPLGIYLFVRWAVSWISVIVEGKGPFSGLGRSWQLTRRAWGHTFAVLFITGIIAAILYGIVVAIFGAIGGAIALAGSQTVSAAFNSIGTFVSSIVLAPFWQAILVVLYFELRARNEGTDLEMRAQQMPPPA